ncbi:MAG: hypothetical protein QM486_10825 [Flavobacteriaceae bacterium]
MENLRLSKKESEELRKKCIEINKILVSKEKAPIRESELAHFILYKSTTYVKITKSGEMIIDY